MSPGGLAQRLEGQRARQLNNPSGDDAPASRGVARGALFAHRYATSEDWNMMTEAVIAAAVTLAAAFFVGWYLGREHARDELADDIDFERAVADAQRFGSGGAA